MKHLRTCQKQLRGVTNRLATHIVRVIQAVAEAWRRHLDRITEEPSYGQALVTVAIAVIELTTGSVRIRSVVRELVAAYVAVLRALRPRFDSYGWDWATDN